MTDQRPAHHYIPPQPPPAPSAPITMADALERMAEQLRRAGWIVVPPTELVQKEGGS